MATHRSRNSAKNWNGGILSSGFKTMQPVTRRPSTKPVWMDNPASVVRTAIKALLQVLLVAPLMWWFAVTPTSAMQRSKPDSSLPVQGTAQPRISKPAQSPAPTSRQSPSLSPEEEYQLQKLKILQELQEEVLKWAQTRFWVIAIISVLIGFFGVRALVREMLAAEVKDAMRASAEAQVAATQGREAIKDVRSEASKYKDMVQELTATAKNVDEKFQEVKSRIDGEATRTSAAANLKITALDEQLVEIRDMVLGLARESARSKESLEEHERRLSEFRQSAASGQAKFEDNSRVRVVVVSHAPGSKTQVFGAKVTNALSQMGFKASEGKWKEGTAQGNVITIDYTPAGDQKVEVIKQVVENLIAKERYEARVTGLNRFPNGFSPKEDHDIRVFL